MDFVAALKEKAKKAGKTIVLCEGEDKRVVEAAAKIVKIVDTVEPEPALVEKYEARYQQFKQIYPACKELFQKIQ